MYAATASCVAQTSSALLSPSPLLPFGLDSLRLAVQYVLCQCIHRAITSACRTASGKESAAILAPFAAEVAEAAVPHFSPAAPAALRSAISQLLLALARLDADALWLLLFRLADQVNSTYLHHYICWSGIASGMC